MYSPKSSKPRNLSARHGSHVSFPAESLMGVLLSQVKCCLFTAKDCEQPTSQQRSEVLADPGCDHAVQQDRAGYIARK